MDKEDLDRFERIEKQLLDLGEALAVSELSGFPFTKYDELKSKHKKKEISFGSDYDSDFLQVIGTKYDNIIHMIWVSLPILIVIADIILAIIFKKWILLLGLLFALIGFISSSPFSPLKSIVSGLGGLTFIGSFFFLDWTWSAIIGSMLFTQIFILTAREQYRMVVEERALQSEVFFCYMFKKGHILIKDNKTNKILNYAK
jgi:uncharacterized membrane protein